MKLITKFIIAITLTLFAHQSHGDDEAAAASATGSVTAPAKGAPKSLNKQTLALTANATLAPVNCGTTSPHLAPP